METGCWKYNIIAILLFAWVSMLSANEGNRVIHENIISLKYGFCQNLDPYLSPLKYKGQGIAFGSEWWQPFRNQIHENNYAPRTGYWAHVGKVDIAGQRAYSVAGTNMLYGLGVHTGWGGHYNWLLYAKKSEFRILLGPYLDVDVMVRQHASEVNKPYSADVAAEVMAMAGMNWIIQREKVGYRIQYILQTNLIGAQFYPDYWQSYYEIYKGQLGRTIHAAGPWNRNRIDHKLAADFLFKKTTWRIGAEHRWLSYGDKNMRWNRHEISILLGCIWNYQVVR